MAHSERVAFGLSLACSSSELMNASMTSLEAYGWYFSVLVGQLLEDSSAAISVLQLPLLYFLPLSYAVRDSLCRPLKRVGNSRSRFFTLILKCAIMAKLKATFTAERSWQFDILQAKEATFLSVDGCSERVSEFSMPGSQLKPSDRSKLNWSIKEHRGIMEKLNVALKDLKEDDSKLFQSNGGEKFVHSLVVKKTKCIEAKSTEVRQDMEAPGHKKRSYDNIFKGMQTVSTSTKKGKMKTTES